ncbi:hypothetical protein CJU90_2803 [Yarrowia sp. C11]|nr:hypothetical protein CJU90_2803 [Yarrowia sp. C11]
MNKQLLFIVKIFIFFFFTLVTKSANASSKYVFLSSMLLTSMVLMSMFVMCVAIICKLYSLSHGMIFL